MKKDLTGLLTFTYNQDGYMLYYRDKPIGGAGVGKRQKPLRGRQVEACRKEYREMATREIDLLISGNGQQRFMDVIARIDAEEVPKEKGYVPFPPGTVRGPYHDKGQCQFLVQTDGGWVPFIRRNADAGKAEAEARQAAEDLAATILGVKPKSEALPLNEVLRETDNFQLYRTPKGVHIIRTTKGKAHSARITVKDVNYLQDLRNDRTFDAACVFDFGCGVFQ